MSLGRHALCRDSVSDGPKPTCAPDEPKKNTLLGFIGGGENRFVLSGAVTTASSLVAVTTAILFYWLTTAISGGDDRLRCSGDDRFRVAVTTASALSSNFATAVAAIHFRLKPFASLARLLGFCS